MTTFNSRAGVVVPASADYSVAQITGAAPLDSPVFINNPTAPTATAGDSSTKVATTGFSSNAANLTSGVAPAARIPVMVGSGASHAPGAAPDPGATAGTTRYLREDGSYAVPVTGTVNPNSLGLNFQNTSSTINACVFGDSRSADPTWQNLVTAGKGWGTSQNFATSGYDMADLFTTIISKTYSQTPGAGVCTTNFLWIGVNEGLDTPHEMAAWLADALWISTPDVLPGTTQVKVRGTAATKTGTGWVTTDHFASGSKTTVNGDSASGTVWAKSAIYPIVSYMLNQNFTWCFQIDSQPQVCHGPMGGNGTVNNGAPYEFYTSGRQTGVATPYAAREAIVGYVTASAYSDTNTMVPAMSNAAAPHTWTWTCQSGCANGAYLEGVIGDGVQDGAAGLSTWALSDFRGTAGGAPAGLVNATVEQGIVSMLAHDGLNIAQIPISNSLDCFITTSDCADGLHPSLVGYTKIANTVLAYTSSLVQPRDRQSIHINDDPLPLVMNYVSPTNWDGSNSLGALITILPVQNMRLTAMYVSGPRLTSCPNPSIIYVSGGTGPQTFQYTMPYSNYTYLLSTQLSQQFYAMPGNQNPITVYIGGNNSTFPCSILAASPLRVTAQFTRF